MLTAQWASLGLQDIDMQKLKDQTAVIAIAKSTFSQLLHDQHDQ